jgi:hypothetical protein
VERTLLPVRKSPGLPVLSSAAEPDPKPPYLSVLHQRHRCRRPRGGRCQSFHRQLVLTTGPPRGRCQGLHERSAATSSRWTSPSSRAILRSSKLLVGQTGKHGAPRGRCQSFHEQLVRPIAENQAWPDLSVSCPQMRSSRSPPLPSRVGARVFMSVFMSAVKGSLASRCAWVGMSTAPAPWWCQTLD